MRSIKEYNSNRSDFTLKNIIGQSLWYSRGNILSVSLMSGFGLPWNYDQNKINKWIHDIDNKDIEHIMPENITLLRAVYKKGSPSFCNIYNENQKDYHNFLWDDSTFKKIITPASQAYLIMDEIMLSKYLYNCGSKNFEKTQNLNEKKLLSILLINSAILQAQFMSNCLRNEEGLFVPKNDISENPYGEPQLQKTDTIPNVTDQALALKAFSMLADTLRDKNYPLFNNEYHFYANKKAAEEIYLMFKDSPEDVFEGKTRELCNVISSCIQYYKLSPENNSILDYTTTLALELESRIDMSGNVLRFSHESGLTSNTSCFIALKTLIESYRITDIYKLLNTAGLIYKRLNILWNPDINLYSLDEDDKYKYTLKDVGAIVSGLNAMRLFGEDKYRQDAENKLLCFFNSAINISGLLLSCFPPPDPEDCEGYLDCLRNNSSSIVYEDFCHPDIPKSADLSIAPVFAKKFTYKPKKHKFNVNSKSFYSDYALYTVNELLMMNYPEIECFYDKNINT